MSKKRRQQVFLTVLAVVLVLVVGRQFGSLFSAGSFSGSSLRSSGADRTDGGDWRQDLPAVEELRLSALEVGSEALGEGRDPFQLRRSEPTPKPDPSKVAARKAIRDARQRKKASPAAPIQPARPTPPPVDVVYLGSFGSEQMRLAVFSDGNEIFNVPQGTVLKDKFVVVRIGFESADLGFVDFPEAPAQRLEIGG